MPLVCLRPRIAANSDDSTGSSRRSSICRYATRPSTIAIAAPPSITGRVASTSIGWPNTLIVRFCSRATSSGAPADAPNSTILSNDWMSATVRPRISSSTCDPTIVRPVRNAMPAHVPTADTISSAIHRCGASATSASVTPAPTIVMPKSRL